MNSAPTTFFTPIPSGCVRRPRNGTSNWGRIERERTRRRQQRVSRSGDRRHSTPPRIVVVLRRTAETIVPPGPSFGREVCNSLPGRPSMRTEFARLATVVALAVAVFPAAGQSQLRNDPANAVAKDDPIYPLLAAHRATLQKREEEGKETRSTFRAWMRVDSPATARLFPNLRFYSLRWDMHRHPEAKEPVVLALDLETVVAIETTTKRVARELWVYDNHEEFGNLLNDYKVTLRNAAEATLVWDASCDIYGQGSKTAPMKKILATE